MKSPAEPEVDGRYPSGIPLSHFPISRDVGRDAKFSLRDRLRLVNEKVSNAVGLHHAFGNLQLTEV